MKAIARAVRYVPLRVTLCAAVALAAAAIALLAYETGALNALERKTVDARFDIRGYTRPDERIVIVSRDARTLTALNDRPPISRSHYARLLDQLRAARPALVGMDIQFIGPDRRDPGADRALIAALARAAPVLLATHDSDTGPAPVPAGQRDPKGVVPASVGVDHDADNVFRRMMYVQVQTKTFPVRAAELVTGKPVDRANFPSNHAWIDFRGTPGTFRTYSMIDVLNGRVPAAALRGRTVLVGVTDPVEKDVAFSTPTSTAPMPGVELHANALATILAGFPLKSAPKGINVLLLLALALLPALLGLRLPALYILLGAAGIFAAFVIGSQLAFDSGRIVSVLPPLLGLVVGTAGACAVDLFTGRRLVAPPISDFFISYRRDESGWPARILKSSLESEFGNSSVFMDLDSIYAGQDWPTRIEDAISGCSVMLVLIGPHWLDAKTRGTNSRRLDDTNDWVRLEIEAGLRRPQLAVVPILLDGATMPGEDELPDSLKPLQRRNAIALTADRWKKDFAALVDSIRDGRIHNFVAQERAIPQLVVKRGGGATASQRFEVNGERVIGRAEDADIDIDDEGVAPQHAKVWPVPDGLAIQDLGSTSGTWVNGTRIESALVADHEDEIRIGETVLAVELSAPDAGRTELAKSSAAGAP